MSRADRKRTNWKSGDVVGRNGKKTRPTSREILRYSQQKLIDRFNSYKTHQQTAFCRGGKIKYRGIFSFEFNLEKIRE